MCDWSVTHDMGNPLHTHTPNKIAFYVVGSKHQFVNTEPQKHTGQLSIQSALDLLVCSHSVKQREWFPDVSLAAVMQLNAEKKQGTQDS